MHQNIELIKNIKNSTESSIGQTNFYRLSTVLAIIYTIVDMVLIVILIIAQNKLLLVGIIIHLILSVGMLKIIYFSIKTSIKSIAQQSSKMLEGIKNKDQTKLNEFISTGELINHTDDHKKLKNRFKLLILLYLVFMIYTYIVYFTNYFS